MRGEELGVDLGQGERGVDVGFAAEPLFVDRGKPVVQAFAQLGQIAPPASEKPQANS